MPTLEEVEEDAARIAELVKHFEQTKEYETQEKVFELLERIDHMHRACVWRLYELTTELGGKGGGTDRDRRSGIQVRHGGCFRHLGRVS